jgi:hypothetical protein
MRVSNRSAREIHWQHLLEQFERSGLSVRACLATTRIPRRVASTKLDTQVEF